MRQRLGPKKVQKLRERTGLPVLFAMVRGGTNHRIDLCLEDGSIMNLYRDGTLEKDDLRWITLPDREQKEEPSAPTP